MLLYEQDNYHRVVVVSEQAIHTEATPGNVFVTVTSILEVPAATACSEAWRQEVVNHQQALGATAQSGGEIVVDLAIRTPESQLDERLDQNINVFLATTTDRYDKKSTAQIGLTARCLQMHGIKTLKNLLPVGMDIVSDLPNCGPKSFNRIKTAIEHAGLTEYFPPEPDMHTVVKHCELKDVPLAVLGAMRVEQIISIEHSLEDILYMSLEDLAVKLSEWSVEDKSAVANYDAAQRLKEEVRAYAQKFAHYKGIADGTIRTLPGIPAQEA